MGELYPPESGDYAWAAANEAKAENKRLLARLEHLERLAGVEQPEPVLVPRKSAAEFMKDAYRAKPLAETRASWLVKDVLTRERLQQALYWLEWYRNRACVEYKAYQSEAIWVLRQLQDLDELGL